jgi:hypothetical protein
MTKLAELSKQIADDLIASDFSKEGEEILHFYDMATNENLSKIERGKALEEIDMRCHIKWLGDLYLPNLTSQNWPDRLEELRKAVWKFKKKLL